MSERVVLVPEYDGDGCPVRMRVAYVPLPPPFEHDPGCDGVRPTFGCYACLAAVKR